MQILPYSVSVVTGVMGWLGGQRKKRNDFLGDLQASIDMLVEKNKELYDEVIRLRTENSELRVELDELTKYIKSCKLPVPERKRKTVK